MTAGGAGAGSERNINPCRTANRLVFSGLHQAQPAAAIEAEFPGGDLVLKEKKIDKQIRNKEDQLKHSDIIHT